VYLRRLDDAVQRQSLCDAPWRENQHAIFNAIGVGTLALTAYQNPDDDLTDACASPMHKSAATSLF
jgi:hypothetical protein